MFTLVVKAVVVEMRVVSAVVPMGTRAVAVQGQCSGVQGQYRGSK